MEYLIVLVSVFLVCLAVTWRFKLRFFDSFKEGLIVFGSLFAIGFVWDTFSIYRGYWSYNQKFLVGINIGLMPLEECIFILVVPFLTLVVYRMVKRN